MNRRRRSLTSSLAWLGAAALLAALGAGCSKKQQPYKPPPRENGDQPDKPRDPAVPDEEKLPVVAPAPIELPEDARHAQMDLREREWEAYSTLRKITVAQKHYMRDLNPIAKDLDGDGLGEVCYLLELSGISELQRPGGFSGATTLGAADWRLFLANDPQGKKIYWKDDPDKPSYYFETHQGYEFLVHNDNHSVVHRIRSDGICERNGYYFILYLPGKEKAVVGSGKVPPGDASLADARERRYCAYAWPKEIGKTGRRAFFSDRFEAVWACWNIVHRYEGLDNIPEPGAAFAKAGEDPDNLDAPPGIAFDPSPTLEKTGLPSCDGETWKIFGERKDVKRKFEKKWTLQQDIEDFKKDGGTRQAWWGE